MYIFIYDPSSGLKGMGLSRDRNHVRMVAVVAVVAMATTRAKMMKMEKTRMRTTTMMGKRKAQIKPMRAFLV
jgi:hypothetical protein